jgi:hypothetical protein
MNLQLLDRVLAEVVGSNPTQSTFIILVIYGIELSSFWITGGQKASQIS